MLPPQALLLDDTHYQRSLQEIHQTQHQAVLTGDHNRQRLEASSRQALY
jgi:hypothetical protein